MISRLLLLLALFSAIRALAADPDPKATPVMAVPSPSPAPTLAPAKVPAPVVTAAPRNDSAVTPVAAFDAFRLIGDRNIFNPNRTGRRERTTEERAPRVDVITLVGTMDYDKAVLAFFDGSDAAYRKALHVGESVDQFKVTKIAADSVEIERAGKTFPMKIAQQLRRPEGADWTMIGADVARNEAQAAQVAEAARAAEGSAPAPIPADASDALRRLMEQRQKQLKQ